MRLSYFAAPFLLFSRVMQHAHAHETPGLATQDQNYPAETNAECTETLSEGEKYRYIVQVLMYRFMA